MAQKCKTGQIWNQKIGKCVQKGPKEAGWSRDKSGKLTLVQEFSTPKGKRYYSGSSKSSKIENAKGSAALEALFKYTTTPSDSIPKYQVKRVLKGKPLKKKKRWW